MTSDYAETLQEFNAAFNRHDVEAMMGLLIDGCVFENTYPPPSGTRYEGQSAVRSYWEDFFRDAPQAVIEIEEMVILGDRGFQRWTYRWDRDRGGTGFVRGVDVFRFESGKIAEKSSYVKG